MEKRKLKRRHLIFYLRVMEDDSPDVLGFMVDITTEGIMVMSEHPLEVGKTFRLKMRVKSYTPEEKYLKFTAVSKWCHQSVNPDFYDTGLELLDITPEDYKEIRHMIKEIGFND
ncbi:MAG: PilZ domain-containing protein [Candidatus Firestonebacteria bacterium]|nr:PilZ domain-containing protein [Candidatus Firestonebacteria bacterium]